MSTLRSSYPALTGTRRRSSIACLDLAQLRKHARDLPRICGHKLQALHVWSLRTHSAVTSQITTGAPTLGPLPNGTQLRARSLGLATPKVRASCNSDGSHIPSCHPSRKLSLTTSPMTRLRTG